MITGSLIVVFWVCIALIGAMSGFVFVQAMGKATL